ncbi:MAG: YihA family ribosome biogenesis GTP-binding protein [Candidatus Solibacter usitatus]|nr:YihA family ribosome biogenesis GTP-binding protein [Candidatus Solibacter usitatus]
MISEFAASAASRDHFPTDGLAEVAFLGRSNVGKSSLINSLVGRKVAFTSSEPGRTRTINFYRVEGSLYLVDLPGYGYAKGSQEEIRGWKALVEDFLRERQTLRLSIVVLDARRGWKDMDLDLKRWLEFHHRPYLVVATKVDQWKNQSERHRALSAFRKEGVEPLWFSAVTGRGVRELWQAIRKTPDNP